MDHYALCVTDAFVARCLALHRSLVRHGNPFLLWVLCFDDASFHALSELGLSEFVLLREDDIDDPGMERMRSDRSRREYFFGTKPLLLLHVLRRDPSAERVTYMDADLYFFASPEGLSGEIEAGSVALTPHRSGDPRRDEVFGRFNAGWASFKNDDVGTSALRWWRERCIEASPDYPVGEVYADQKYLSQMPALFDRVVAIEHKGANVAPWNVHTSGRIAVRDDTVTIDEEELVFFHFHGLQRWSARIFDPGWTAKGDARILRRHAYVPYLIDLKACELLLPVSLRQQARPAPWGGSRPRAWWWRAGRQVVRIVKAVLSRRLILVPRSNREETRQRRSSNAA